jgi:hypothetical protein
LFISEGASRAASGEHPYESDSGEGHQTGGLRLDKASYLKKD